MDTGKTFSKVVAVVTSFLLAVAMMPAGAIAAFASELQQDDAALVAATPITNSEEYSGDASSATTETAPDSTADAITEAQTASSASVIQASSLEAATDVAPVATMAEQVDDQGLKYRVSGRSAYITGAQDKAMKLLVVPTSIGGYAVRGIDSSAFSRFEDLESVVIPDSVRSVGSNAFYGCTRLSHLDLGMGDELTLGGSAFGNCTKLTSVAIPAGIATSGAPFTGSALSTVTFADGIKQIPAELFEGCASLAAIDIPQTVRTIGENAFNGCKDLASITLPDALRSVGYSAFYDCERLVSLDLGEGTDITLSSYAFGNCTKLTEVTVPTGVKTDGPPFYGSGLVNVVIADGVKAIPNELFEGCKSLISVTIPSSVKTIGSEAFYSCEELAQIAIPATVRNIGSSAFARCTHLISVQLGECEELVLGDGAFANCTKLQSITIPAKATAKSAPFSNSGLTTAVIAEGATAVPATLFQSCSNLESVTIPSTVTSIGDSAFESCAELTSIDLPQALISVGQEAFYGCERLASIDLSKCSGLFLGASSFANCKKLTSASLPADFTTYGAVFGGSGLIGVTLAEGMKTIPAELFSGCASLESVEIPSTVTEIGSYAFGRCAELTSLTLPDSVRRVGEDAFYGCEQLSSLDLGAGPELQLCDDAFGSCTKLTTVAIPAGVTTSGAPFDGSGLASVTLADAATSIPDNLFSGCSSLANVSIPADVKSIGSQAFYNCSSLVAINLPSKLRTIGSSAFSNCSSLESVNVPSTVNSIGSSAFYRCAESFKLSVAQNSYARKWAEDNNVAYELTAESLPDYEVEGDLTADGLVYRVVNGEARIVGFDGAAATKLVIPATIGGYKVTSIADYAFRYCSELEELTIPDTMGIIGNCAFGDCTRLSSLDLGSSDELTLGSGAFQNCTKLTSVAVPLGISLKGAPFSGSGLTSATLAEGTTAIPAYLFASCESLISVEIPDTVRSIGDYAFQYCRELASIALPSSVRSVGAYAFSGCERLASVDLGAARELKLETGAFANCTRLKELSVPVGLTSNGAPFDGSGLTSVQLAEGLADISAKLFRGCASLASVNIPSSVRTIGDYAFYGCKELEVITLPASMRKVGIYAFAGCSRLTNLDLGENSSLQLWSGAFSDCTKLANVTIPAGLTTNGAPFSGSGLVSATLAEGMTTVPDYLFSGCASLASVSIPSTVRSIGDYAFQGCSELQAFEVPGSVRSVGAYAFSDCERLASVDLGTGDDLTLKTGCFANCAKLQNISIPAGLESDGAPFGGSGLTSVQLAEGMTIIPARLFRGCGSLVSVSIPSTVRAIGDYAFSECAELESVAIPDAMLSIGSYAFSGCRRLASLDLGESDSLVLHSSAFGSCERLRAVTVPVGITTNGAPFSGSGLTSVTLAEGMTAVPDYLFSGCESLASISLPDSVRTIGDYAFNGCAELAALALPDSVKRVGSYAFASCDCLSSVDLGQGDELVLGSGAFSSCTKLTQITIPVALETEGAPFSNSGIQTAYVAEGMTALPDRLFINCESLASVTLPSTLKSIGYQSFYSCDALTSVDLPEGLNSVGDYAFAYCPNLKYVYVPESVETIGYGGFPDAHTANMLVLHVADNSPAEIWAIQNGVSFEVYGGNALRYEGYALDMSATSFYSTTPANYSGTYVPMTLTYKVKDDAFDAMSGLQMTFQLTANMQVLEGSVTADGALLEDYSYSQSSGTLTVPITAQEGRIQLSARVLEAGTTAAFAQFEYYSGGEQRTELIGVLRIAKQELSLDAPGIVGASAFRVSGVTTPGENVDLYVADQKVATVKAKKDGTYSESINLPEPRQDGKKYLVMAQLQSDEDVTASAIVKYEAKTPTLAGFDMYYNSNQADHVDLLASMGQRLNISLAPGHRFTFKVVFRDSEDITNVYVTSTKNGVTKTMEAVETATEGLYVASGYFDENNHNYAPGTLGVSYVTPYGAEAIDSDFNVDDPDYPERWKNATVNKTIDTADEKLYDVTLTDGQEFQFTEKTETLADAWAELFPDKPAPESVASLSIQSEQPQSDLSTQAGEELGEAASEFLSELIESYGTDVIVGGVETASGDKAYVVREGGSTLRYYLLNPATNAVKTWAMKALTANGLEGGLMYDLDLSTISSDSWTTAGAIVGAAEGLYYGVEKSININNARSNINSNPNLTPSQKQYANQQLSQLHSSYMALSAVKIAGSVGIALAFTGVPGIIAGITFGVVTGLIGSYLDKKLAAVESGAIFANFLIDPSGIVYEAVRSNRLRGAKVTAYYRASMDDDPIVWDAEEFSQQNPLYTGVEGAYAWVTPEGFWQVKVELDGYEPWTSEWLPVPPVQENVDASMVSLAAPEVEWIEATENELRVKFTKYMDVQSISGASLRDANGQDIAYKLVYDTNDAGADAAYADLFTFEFVGQSFAQGSAINVTLPAEAKSYAGVSVSSANLIANVGNLKSIQVAPSVELEFGARVTVRARVEGATADTVLQAESNSSAIVRVVSVTRVDDENWDIVVEGRLPGQTGIAISVTGSALAAEVEANVLMDASFGGFEDCDHALVYHPAVAPTATATGVAEYWSCSKCGMLFRDAQGLFEAGEADLVIPKTAAKNIAECSIALAGKTYTGKAIVQDPLIKDGTVTLVNGTDYTFATTNNTTAGMAKVTINGLGAYTGTIVKEFQIAKAGQLMVANGSTKTLKAKKLKKKAFTVKKAINVTKPQGLVTYKNVSAKKKLKKFKVNSKTGAIKVPKRSKKGTYKLKVLVTAVGNANYLPGSKTVTVKIKVK